MMKNKKGQVMILIVFFIMATIILVIGAVIGPLGAEIATKFYAEGDRIIARSQTHLSEIDDPAVAASINATFAAARASQVDNITVTSNLYQYSWAFVLILTALVLFIFTRRMVEYGAGGFI